MNMMIYNLSLDIIRVEIQKDWIYFVNVDEDLETEGNLGDNQKQLKTQQVMKIKTKKMPIIFYQL